ncbi:MAG TPA: hypothetical protein PKO15_11520 [Fibrobacteria bacterium]|nr:hypothetical protein [Fibrobacteria bacterium]HOX50426.1 hypothetical protein [Fibrobacteria bacterium]
MILSLLGCLFCHQSHDSHQLKEYKELSTCEVERWTVGRASKDQTGSPSLEVDGLEFRFRSGTKVTGWTLLGGPVIQPLLDTATLRVYWLTFHEVCELDIRHRRVRTLLRGNWISAVGNQWISDRMLHVKGVDPDTCYRFRLDAARRLERVPCTKGGL